MNKFESLKEIASDQYKYKNCLYDNKDYMYHINMVVDNVEENFGVFKFIDDYELTKISALFHDSIEDAGITFNNIKTITNTQVAKIVLAVSDTPAENRLLRHLLTMPRTIQDYRAIILKMCDILANGTYSKENGSDMYVKYKEEYEYRKPIFKLALNWYKDKLNENELINFWSKLDKLFE